MHRNLRRGIRSELSLIPTSMGTWSGWLRPLTPTPSGAGWPVHGQPPAAARSIDAAINRYLSCDMFWNGAECIGTCVCPRAARAAVAAAAAHDTSAAAVVSSMRQVQPTGTLMTCGVSFPLNVTCTQS